MYMHISKFLFFQIKKNRIYDIKTRLTNQAFVTVKVEDDLNFNS